VTACLALVTEEGFMAKISSSSSSSILNAFVTLEAFFDCNAGLLVVTADAAGSAANTLSATVTVAGLLTPAFDEFVLDEELNMSANISSSSTALVGGISLDFDVFSTGTDTRLSANKSSTT